MLTFHLRFPLLFLMKQNQQHGVVASIEALSMFLLEETQHFTTIPIVPSKEIIVVSSRNSMKNVCKNAVVLPWRTWNCVVRNTKLLLATNPCDEMVEIHNPSCTIDGSKRGFICSLSSVQLAIQWAIYALIQQYCRVKSEIVLWEMQNDSWPQIHVVNWQKSNGQTGGAWVDKLGAHLDLL